jgi:hypothetical protein
LSTQPPVSTKATTISLLVSMIVDIGDFEFNTDIGRICAEGLLVEKGSPRCERLAAPRRRGPSGRAWCLRSSFACRSSLLPRAHSCRRYLPALAGAHPSVRPRAGGPPAHAVARRNEFPWWPWRSGSTPPLSLTRLPASVAACCPWRGPSSGGRLGARGPVPKGSGRPTCPAATTRASRPTPTRGSCAGGTARRWPLRRACRHRGGATGGVEGQAGTRRRVTEGAAEVVGARA